VEEVLKNIFLKSYQMKKYSDDSGWIDDNDNKFDYSSNGEIDWCGSSNAGKNERKPDTRFCYIYPEIKNIILKKDNGEVIHLGSDYSYEINENGVYSLSFNSMIDPEQAPMGDIIINWGDGDKQVISNQDYHADSEYPHKISHSYKNIFSQVGIKIQIFDNWGFSRCCFGNDNCGGPDSESLCP
jgi:hypothetical protein